MTNIRKRTAKATHGKNLWLLLVFCLALLFVIAISMVLKITNTASQSVFDGTHRLTIATDAAPFYVLSFAPEDRSIVIAKITTEEAYEANRIGQQLKIPIDATVSFPFKEGEHIDTQLFYMLTNYTALKTKLTVFDIVRLWWFAKSVPAHAVTKTDIAIRSTENNLNESQVLEETSSHLFADASISQEKLSVQVVNATGESGVGARFAKLLSHMGGNVIVVTTADSIVNISSIAYYGEESYTLARFEKILSIPSSQLYIPGIADIVITLGKDSLDKKIF